jgi:hypothetical protein
MRRNQEEGLMSSELAYPGSVGPRVLIVGDSQIFGLGTNGRTLGKLAADKLGAAAVLDVSGVSKTVADTLADADQIRAFRPSVAVLCCGGTESLVHAGPVVQRLIERWAPPTWHGVNGLDPRPYYSRRLGRRIRQRITSRLKVAVKRVVVHGTGGQRRIPVDELRRDLQALLALLAETGCLSVFVSMWEADDRLFPRTGRAMAETQTVLAQCIAEHSHAILIDAWRALDYWGDFQEDHLHFNEVGHRRIAGLVVQAVLPATQADGTRERDSGARTVLAGAGLTTPPGPHPPGPLPGSAADRADRRADRV